jgi:hypothetical protein
MARRREKPLLHREAATVSFGGDSGLSNSEFKKAVSAVQV